MKNIDAMKRDLAAKQDAARQKYVAVCAKAEAESRLLTDEEKAEVNTLVEAANTLKTEIARAESDAAIGSVIENLVPTPHRATALVPRTGGGGGVPARVASMGEQFVSSDAYSFFRSGLHRTSAAWRSPSVELTPDRAWNSSWAATLTEDPASGGALVVPDYRPGILSILTRRLVVADLLAPGTTDSNLISYMKETAFTNAADTVAEGAAKPESTLTFAPASDPVRKIAHWLPVTEEMLEDVPQIKSYIDARLRLGVELTEEDQLLNGTSTAPDIVGIRNRPGLAPDVVQAVAPDTAADAIYRQMMAIFTTSYLMPDGIVINPADWQKIQLAKTSQGEYLGGGPFTAPAGPMLWGLPIVVTPAIPALTVLVGAFKTAAQVFRKGGIRVEASNSHQDFFVKNLVAIRAEERLALAVYRPGAIGEVIVL